MDSTTATNALHFIFRFLEKKDITLNKVIEYGAQFDSTNILLSNN
jgi:hypothetical protein